MAKTTTSAAGGLASIFGTILSALGSYQSARMDRQNLKSLAAMDAITAKIAELGARDALARGQWEAARVSASAGQLKSRQRAAMAANGLDLGVGSAAELQASPDLMKEIAMQQALTNALRSAWGYRLQGTNFTNRSAMASAAAGAISPGMSAVGTLLTNGGQVADGWYAIRDALSQPQQAPAPVEDRSWQLGAQAYPVSLL